MHKFSKNKFLFTVLGSAIVAIAFVSLFYFPMYVEYWQHSWGWISLVTLLLVCISPFGHNVIGEPAAKLSIGKCLQYMGLSYLLLLLFMFSMCVLFTTTVMPISPAEVPLLLSFIFDAETHDDLGYPWVLYILGLVLLVMIYQHQHNYKFSGVLAGIIPKRFLTEKVTRVIDALPEFVFYFSMLMLVGLTVLAAVKGLSYILGYPLDYDVSLEMIGVAFALVYLPLSPIWKTSLARLKSVSSLGKSLALLMLGLIAFVLAIYGLLVFFFESFPAYFSPLKAQMPPLDPSFYFGQLDLNGLLWASSLLSMMVVARVWIQWMQGYTVRMAVVILLLPIVLVVLFWQVGVQNEWFSFATLTQFLTHFWISPYAEGISVLGCVLLIILFWRENTWTREICEQWPNLKEAEVYVNSGELLSRTAPLVTATMMFSLLTGLFFIKTLLVSMGVLLSLVVFLAVIHLIIHSLRKSLCSNELKN